MTEPEKAAKQSGKLTVADLKAKYNAVVDKNRSLKEKLDTANGDIKKLTDAVKARDQAIDSRDSKIQELTKLTADLQAKLDKANNSIFSDISKELFGTNQTQEQQNTEDQSEIVAQLNQERRELIEKIKSFENADKANKELIEKYKKAISDFETEHKSLKDKIIEFENKKYDSVTDISSEVSDLIKENNNLREKLRLSELGRTDSTKYDLLNEENKLLKNSNNDLSQQMKLLNKKIQDMQDEISKNEQLKEQINQLKTNQDETNDKYVALQRENSSLLAKYNESKDEIQRLNDTLQKTQKDIDNKMRESNQFQASFNEEKLNLAQEISRLKAEIDSKAQNINQLNADMLNLKTERNNLENSNKELKLELSEAEKHQNELTNQLQKAQNEINEQLKKVNNNLSEIQELRQSNDELKSQYDTMKRDLHAEKLSNETLQSSLEEKSKRIRNLEERNKEKLDFSTELQNAYERIKQENEKLKKEKEDFENSNNSKLQELEAQLTETRASLEAESVKVQNLTKQRDKAESARRVSDKKVAALEQEKTKLTTRLSAVEKDRKHSTQGSNSSIFPNYIRKVLLQFFLQDGSTRESLIPVILNLVECDEKIIRQAQRSWRESNQFISHLFNF